MREDVDDNVVDSTIVGSPPVPSYCLLVNSCTQRPVHEKGCLKKKTIWVFGRELKLTGGLFLLKARAIPSHSWSYHLGTK